MVELRRGNYWVAAVDQMVEMGASPGLVGVAVKHLA